MRKGANSLLCDDFIQLPESLQFENNHNNVADGEYILDKVVWNPSDSLGPICNTYIQYVRNYHEILCISCFSGYSLDNSNKTNIVDILINKTTPVETLNEQFYI